MRKCLGWFAICFTHHHRRRCLFLVARGLQPVEIADIPDISSISFFRSLYFSPFLSTHVSLYTLLREFSWRPSILLYYIVLHIGHSIFAARTPIFDVHKREYSVVTSNQACIYASAQCLNYKGRVVYHIHSSTRSKWTFLSIFIFASGPN